MHVCLVVCTGGGNAAHVAAGMYSLHGAKVNMFLSDDNEEQRWQDNIAGGIQVHKKYEGDTHTGAAGFAGCPSGQHKGGAVLCCRSGIMVGT